MVRALELAPPSEEKENPFSRFNRLTGKIAMTGGVILVPFAPGLAAIAIAGGTLDYASSNTFESIRKDWQKK